jgi:hypothetical protein
LVERHEFNRAWSSAGGRRHPEKRATRRYRRDPPHPRSISVRAKWRGRTQASCPGRRNERRVPKCPRRVGPASRVERRRRRRRRPRSPPRPTVPVFRARLRPTLGSAIQRAPAASASRRTSWSPRGLSTESPPTAAPLRRRPQVAAQLGRGCGAWHAKVGRPAAGRRSRPAARAMGGMAPIPFRLSSLLAAEPTAACEQPRPSGPS